MMCTKAKFLLITESDRHSWMQLLEDALTPLGTLEFKDKNHAISLILHGSYDLIIIDVPYVKGVPRLLSQIRDERPNAKIVVAATTPTWHRAREAFQKGAMDYINRSMSVSDLRSTFEQILERLPRPTVGFNLREEPAMTNEVILFADNNQKFLKTRKEFLERAGYEVITASNPEEAKRILEEENVDLAILDQRLTDDNDDKDKSGLDVAREAGRYVPKIILTQFPNWEATREALKPSLQGLSLALDYIDKAAGPEALLRAVRGSLNLRVFIAHGRDNETKETVARFIEKLGLWAIILNEKPGGGSSIIEKFESYSHVAFAIVLLTPDDIGTLRDQPQELKPRARQNVIFELGYFIGKLGRKKVGVLCKGGVEIPSNYLGVQYIQMDDGGGWKLALAREIQKAGIDVNLNRATEE